MYLPSSIIDCMRVHSMSQSIRSLLQQNTSNQSPSSTLCIVLSVQHSTHIRFGSMMKCTLEFSSLSCHGNRCLRFWNSSFQTHTSVCITQGRERRRRRWDYPQFTWKLCSVKKGVKGAIIHIIKYSTENRDCRDWRHSSRPCSPCDAVNMVVVCVCA